MCLDKDIDVVDYEYEKIVIEHRRNIALTDEQRMVDKKKKRTYTPDFLITYANGRRMMVEIKPLCNVRISSTQRKKFIGEQYCAMHGLTYDILTLEDIIKYEIGLGISMPDHNKARKCNDDDDIEETLS